MFDECELIPERAQGAAESLAAEEEFEEITSDEVDRVVGILEELMASVHSENIRSYLEEAMNNIYYLIYDDEDDEDEDDDGPLWEAA